MQPQLNQNSRKRHMNGGVFIIYFKSIAETCLATSEGCWRQSPQKPVVMPSDLFLGNGYKHFDLILIVGKYQQVN